MLTVNPGSSSVRLAVFDLDLDVIKDGPALYAQHPVDDEATWRQIDDFVRRIDPPELIAHRLVHGGEVVRRPTVVDDRLLEELRPVVSLDPLHLPATLSLVEGIGRRMPDLPQVLCPDTYFHSDLPEVAATYAVPANWQQRFGVRRYGFHGLSYAWALSRAADLLHRAPDTLHLVAAHLGGGASVCAIRDGRSVDTSMGFTPLDGVPMARRSGAVDPGLLLWLLDGRLDRDDLDHALNHESGLYGLSNGRSDDTRDLVRAAEAGDDAARLALDVYAHRVKREIAAAATSLARVDALVFTGEIGWDQPEVRDAICAGLGQLGVRLPLDSTDRADDRVVSSAASTPVLVVQTQENRQLARDAVTAMPRARSSA